MRRSNDLLVAYTKAVSQGVWVFFFFSLLGQRERPPQRALTGSTVASATLMDVAGTVGHAMDTYSQAKHGPKSRSATP